MWKNTVERGRPQMTIRRMRIAYWIPKATNIHPQYVTHCFSTATIVAISHPNVTSHVRCLFLSLLSRVQSRQYPVHRTLNESYFPSFGQGWMPYLSKTGDKSSFCVKSHWSCWTAAEKTNSDLSVSEHSQHWALSIRSLWTCVRSVSFVPTRFTAQHSGTHMYQPLHNQEAVHLGTWHERRTNARQLKTVLSAPKQQ